VVEALEEGLRIPQVADVPSAEPTPDS
jgi:hypothetical protein